MGKRPYLRKGAPPIFTVLWFFKVLCVTVYHAKFLPGETKEVSWAHYGVLQGNDFRQQFTQTVHSSFVCSIPCFQYEICVVQERNIAKAWKQGYECPLSSTIQPFSTIGMASTKRWWSNDKSGFRSQQVTMYLWWGPVIKPVKHLLHLTVHPQVWCMTFELP